jgi:hypothetical protein
MLLRGAGTFKTTEIAIPVAREATTALKNTQE